MNLKKTYTIPIEEKDAKEIEKIVKKDNITRTQIFREAIQLYLKKRREEVS